ncbi:MAG: hypothetical protein J2P17_10620, partial [Mycobacterium sp.]|nr:hypothetical protein [Mycobacterium sp.]
MEWNPARGVFEATSTDSTHRVHDGGLPPEVAEQVRQAKRTVDSWDTGVAGTTPARRQPMLDSIHQAAASLDGDSSGDDQQALRDWALEAGLLAPDDSPTVGGDSDDDMPDAPAEPHPPVHDANPDEDDRRSWFDSDESISDGDEYTHGMLYRVVRQQFEDFRIWTRQQTPIDHKRVHVHARGDHNTTPAYDVARYTDVWDQPVTMMQIKTCIIPNGPYEVP